MAAEVAAAPRVAIVIPVWNKVEVTLRCLQALAATTPDDLYHVVIVDNASSDETPQLLASLEGDVTVVTNPENVGYTLACNQGVAAGPATEHVLFLNNDTEPQPGWLEALLAVVDEDPAVGVVGARLVYPDGTLQEAGCVVFADGSGWQVGRGGPATAPVALQRAEPDYCSGAALLVRRSFLDQVGGGYDPAFAPGYYEDTDLCFAARARGWKVVYEPSSVVVHHEGTSAGTDLGAGMKRHQVVNRERFVQRWSSALAAHEPPPEVTGLAPTSADRRRRAPGLPRRRAGGDRPERQRILVVDPLLPMHDRASGSLRLFRIVEAMRAAGHEVTFVARNGLGGERYADDLRRLGVEVHPLDVERLAELGQHVRGPRLDLDGLLARGAFDTAWLSFHDLALQYVHHLRRCSPGTHVVVDSVDVHHLRELRQAELAGDRAALVTAGRTKLREAWSYSLADSVVAVTEADAEVLRRLVPGTRVDVVGNVHPVPDEVAPLAGRDGVLFIGNPSHPPNVDAALWLCREVAPAIQAKEPGTRITIIGAPYPQPVHAAARANGVEMAGWVPDTAPHLDAARASIAPLRVGAGMKGKVGEALACGLPVAMTSLGAEGMGIEDGVHGLVADDAESLALATCELLRDDALWHRLSAAGRRLVDDRWSPRAVAGALAAALSG